MTFIEPLPDDLYKLTGYENPYNWIIYSQKNTGSHPHSDPDLTGAWNYLFNGYKYWAIFPHSAVKSHSVQCSACNQNVEEFEDEDDIWYTLRWFKHVLPRLRHIKVVSNLKLAKHQNLNFLCLMSEIKF